MKKFLRITAALAAVFAMVNFVACKDDDDDGGDEGNGFENTYWVQVDDSKDEGGNTLTYSAVRYVHIKDGTTGTIYETSEDTLDSAAEELKTGGVTGSKEVAYNENSFTYAIEGSAIKITYKDEKGTDVSLNVTVAEDKNSFSYKDGEDTLTYKKASEVPKAAKVTYTVKTTNPTDPAEPGTPTDPVEPGTGTTNGFENTYWVLADLDMDEEGYTITASETDYLHVKDGTTGTAYQTSETFDSAVEELISGGVTASREVEYDENFNFTYTIEGSAIKITYKDETEKDVSFSATLADDKNSFSYTNDEGYTVTYKKAPEAPKAAKVTYTVKIHSFTGLGFADFPAGSLAGKVGDKNDKATVISSIEEAYSEKGVYLPYIVANNAEGNELWDVRGVKIRGGSGHFKVRFPEDTKLSSCINYNGGAGKDISATFTAVYTGAEKNVDRYIMVPVTKNGTVTVSYKTVSSSKGSTTCQLGLFSKAGTAIKVDTVDTLTSTEGTLVADVTADAEEVYLVFSRNGAEGGGVDIYSIKVE